MKRARSRALLLAAAAVLLVGAWVAWRWPDRDLRPAVVVPGARFGSGYHWLADGEALLVEYVEDEEPGYGSCRLLRLRLADGRRLPIARLPASAWLAGRPDQANVSPDGRWALWFRDLLATAEPLRGDNPQSWSRYQAETSGWPARGDAKWLPDSTGWVGLADSDVYGGVRLRSCRLGRQDFREVRLALAPRDHPVVLAGADQEGHALLQAGERGLLAVDCRTGAVLRRDDVALPVNELVSECRASPRGDRVVWLTRTLHRGLLHDMIARLSWRRKGPEPFDCSVWVTDARGGDLRRIWRRSLPNEWNGCEYGAARWMPDGRRVTFFVAGILYAISTD